MMRPLGAMMLLPIFNSGTLGGPLIRNALVLMIALPAVPVYRDWPTLQLTMSFWNFGWIVLTELVIGLMLGFAAAIPFWAVDMAGFVIDTMRGASMSNVLNPLLGAQSSIYGILFTQLLSVLFLMLGGFNQLMSSIYYSYKTLPPGGGFTFNPGFLTFISHEWRLMYELCLGFAMPSMVAMLLVDMALGLINRSAQQLNVFFLSMPIKSVMSLLLLIISLNFAFGNYLAKVDAFEREVGRLLRSLM